jgi:hypothetical protein
MAVDFVFRRVRKISESDCYLRSTRLSVRMEQLGSHWTDLNEIWYLRVLRKSVEKSQVSINSDNNRYFTRRPMYIYENISLNSS